MNCSQVPSPRRQASTSVNVGQRPLRLYAKPLPPPPIDIIDPFFPLPLLHLPSTGLTVPRRYHCCYHPRLPPAQILPALRASPVAPSMASSSGSSGSADNSTSASASSNNEAPSQTSERDLAQVRWVPVLMPSPSPSSPSTLSRLPATPYVVLLSHALACTCTHAKRLPVTLLPGTEQICTGRGHGQKGKCPIPRSSPSMG